MSEIEELASWIKANADKAGTPEFETVANALEEMVGGASLEPAAPVDDLATPPTVTMEELSAPSAESTVPRETDPFARLRALSAGRDGLGPSQAAMRKLTIGTQDVGRGLANAAAMPVDLPNMLLNSLIGTFDAGSQMLGGEGTDFRFGMIGDDIQEGAGAAADFLGFTGVAPEDMTPSERMLGKLIEFGTEAGALGGTTATLAKGANARQLAVTDPGLAASTNPVGAAPVAVAAPTAIDGILSAMGSTKTSLINDTATGAGAGLGTGAVSELSDNPVYKFLAALVGGVGGKAAKDIAVDGPGQIVRGVKSARIADDFTDGDRVVSNRAVDRASSIAQNRIPNVEREADLLEAELNSFRQQDGITPPTDALTQTPETLQLAKAARLGAGMDADDAARIGGGFARADNALVGKAREKVEGLRPDDVDSPELGPDGLPVSRNVAFEDSTLPAGEAASRGRLADAERLVEEKQQELTRAQELLRRAGSPIEDRAGGAGEASTKIDERIVDNTLRPMARHKNELFDVDPNREFELDTPNLDRVPDEIDARTGDLRTGNPEEPNPTLADIRQRNRQRAASEADETGETPPPKPATIGGLSATRAGLADDIRQARKDGNIPKLKHLERVKRALNADIRRVADDPDIEDISAARGPEEDSFAPFNRRGDDVAEDVDAAEAPNEGFSRAPPTRASVVAGLREADEFYRGRFAPFTRGAGGKLRKEVNADDLSKPTRQPSQTVRRLFINATNAGPSEAVKDLREIIDLAPNPEEGVAAVREYVLANLSGVLNPDKTIHNGRLHDWIAKRRDIFADGAFPEIKEDLDRLLRLSEEGEAAKSQIAKDLKARTKEMNLTEKEIDQSIFHLRTNNRLSAKNAVRKVFNDTSSNPRDRAAEITETIAASGDERAMKGWKASVVDFLMDSIETTNASKSGDGQAAISKASAVKVFKEHREALAKVFSDEEMGALHRAQRILQTFDNQTVQSLPGSPTAERGQLLARSAEVLLKLRYGGLKGGNLMRSLKLAFPGIGDDPDLADINYLIGKFALDPEVALKMMRRDTSHVSPAQEKQFTEGLKTLLGLQEFQRTREEERNRKRNPPTIQPGTGDSAAGERGSIRVGNRGLKVGDPTGRTSVSGRPLYYAGNGAVYSEKTKTFPLKGKWYTFPSVDENGKSMSEDHLAEYVAKNGPLDPITGERFPVFDTLNAAERYAKERSSSRLKDRIQ